MPKAAPITLASFELEIEESILKSGLRLFEKGTVGQPESMSSSEFTVEVEDGQSTYTVGYELKSGKFTTYTCECGKADPVCKHMAAVLLYLQQDQVGEGLTMLKKTKARGRKPKSEQAEQPEATVDLKKPKKPKQPPKPKKVPIPEQVDEIVSRVSEAEMRSFLSLYADKNPDFTLILLTYFADHNPYANRDACLKLLKELLKNSLSQLYKLSGNRAAYFAGLLDDKLSFLLDGTERQWESGNYEGALTLLSVLMEGGIYFLNRNRTENAMVVSDMRKMAFEKLMGHLCKPEVLEEEELRLFALRQLEYVVKEECKEADYWSSQTIISALLPVLKTEQEVDMLFVHYETALLKKLKEPFNTFALPGYTETSVRFQKIVGLKVQALAKIGAEDAVKRYGNRFKDSPSVQFEIASYFMERQLYGQAIQLGEEVMESKIFSLQPVRNTELIKELRLLLVKAYLKVSDENKAAYYAKELLSNTRNQHVYLELRKILPGPLLSRVLNEMIDRTEKNMADQTNMGYLLYLLYFAEKWDKFLSLLKTSDSDIILTHDHLLPPEYASQLVTLYNEKIMEYLSLSKYYDYLSRCSHMLIRTAILAGKDATFQLLHELKTSHKKKRPLHNSLDVVKSVLDKKQVLEIYKQKWEMGRVPLNDSLWNSTITFFSFPL